MNDLLRLKIDARPRFGVHVSVAGGLVNAFTEGTRLGCDCVQIFVKNQRQWRSTPLTDDQIAAFRSVRSATNLTPVIAHANYLLNLASPVERVRSMSIDVLADELTRCEALGVEGLVLHPGSHLGDAECRMGNGEWRMTESESGGIERIAEALDEVHRRCSGFAAGILLETTAGQGTNLGWRFEHLRGMLDRVADPDRVGVCLDTCHLFAAGYDSRTPETYAATIDELDRVIGLARVRCIHMNDSKREFASRVDRHEHIGKGKIGKGGFANFVNDPRFLGVPMILETPKGTDGRGSDLDKVNLRRLRSMMK